MLSAEKPADFNLRVLAGLSPAKELEDHPLLTHERRVALFFGANRGGAHAHVDLGSLLGRQERRADELSVRKMLHLAIEYRGK
jgi:hypothetical protein